MPRQPLAGRYRWKMQSRLTCAGKSAEVAARRCNIHSSHTHTMHLHLQRSVYYRRSNTAFGLGDGWKPMRIKVGGKTKKGSTVPRFIQPLPHRWKMGWDDFNNTFNRFNAFARVLASAWNQRDAIAGGKFTVYTHCCSVFSAALPATNVWVCVYTYKHIQTHTHVSTLITIGISIKLI